MRARMAPIARYRTLSTAFRAAAARLSCSPTATFVSVRPTCSRLQLPYRPRASGLVTCLYRGLPIAGIWSRLAAAEIDHRFLPSVLVGLRLGPRQALFRLDHRAARRDAAAESGDLRRSPISWPTTTPWARPCGGLGLEVAIPPMVVDHVCSEPSFAELARRELRWARTIRLVDPLGYAGSVVTHPLPFALAAAGLGGFGAVSLAVLALVLACGFLVPLQFARSLWGRTSADLARSGARSVELCDILGKLPAVAGELAGPPLQDRAGRDAHARPEAGNRETGRRCARCSCRLRPSTASTAGRDPATRPGARFARSGSRPGSRSPPRWSRTASSSTRRRIGFGSPMSHRGARDYDLVVLHTSTPSFAADVAAVEALKAVNPQLKAGLIGAKVAVEADKSLKAAPVVDFVARNEFDFTIKEVADGRALKDVKGLSYRNDEGVIVHNPDRAVLENMDALPFVTPVYKRDLDNRELLHRLPEAPLHLALHRPRLQIALHVLPLAADGRRPPLSHAQRRPRHRRDPLGAEGLPAGERSSSSTTTPSPTICRGPKRSPGSSASSASPGRATPRPTCRARP